MKEKHDKSIWVNRPELEWMGDSSVLFPLESQKPKSIEDDSNQLDSLLSLLTWGKYLLTPKKPKSSMQHPISPQHIMYPTTTPDVEKGNVTPLSSIHDYPLSFLNQQDYSILPMPVFHEDYFLE